MRGFTIILGSAAMLIAGSAQAGVSGLYGTGVDVAGGVDKAWTIVSSTAFRARAVLRIRSPGPAFRTPTG